MALVYQKQNNSLSNFFFCLLFWVFAIISLTTGALSLANHIKVKSQSTFICIPLNVTLEGTILFWKVESPFFNQIQTIIENEENQTNDIKIGVPRNCYFFDSSLHWNEIVSRKQMMDIIIVFGVFSSLVVIFAFTFVICKCFCIEKPILEESNQPLHDSHICTVE